MKNLYLPGAILLLSACASSPAVRQPPMAAIRQSPAIPMVSTPSASMPASPEVAMTRPPGGIPSQSLANRPEVQAFIREMAARHRFDANDLLSVFSRAEAKPSIVRAMSRPAEAKPWYDYRGIFVNSKRIRGGLKFWRANAATLAKAERIYGVPPEIVVAIIGVETQYGGNMGSFRVLEALSTLAFDYPRRAAYFRKELENFLLLTRNEGIDPLTPRGSYAGAMGYGQFMPSSYLSYAVDFDGDGHRDLWRDPKDAIGSVAHYFQGYGWRAGAPVAVPARVSGTRYPALVSQRLSRPKDSIASLQAQGVMPEAPVSGAQTAMLLEYEGRDGMEYWLGFDNFYVITRYNHSRLYAMAVYQLSQKIREQYALYPDTRSVERVARAD